MSDYDFFEDGIDELLVSQKKESAVGTKQKFPVSYMSKEGTYIFRLYPENYHGKPRMRRIIWSYQLDKFRRVLSNKDDNRVDSLLESVKQYDNPSNKFWSHKKKQEAIMLGYLIGAPTDKNIQPAGTASLLVMNWIQMSSLDSFFESLEEEGIRLKDFLNPKNRSNAIKMTIKKVQKGKKTETVVNVSATSSSDYELPPLVDVLPNGVEFPGLDYLHVKHDAKLTDEIFSEFKKFIMDKVNKTREVKEKNSYNPDEDNQEGGYNVRGKSDEIDFSDDESLIEIGRSKY